MKSLPSRLTAHLRLNFLPPYFFYRLVFTTVSSLNPILLNARMTQKLPRRLLVAMVLAYALLGLLGRDPWRTEDAISFGVALSMSQGSWLDFFSQNFLTHVMGATYYAEPMFTFAWVAVWIKLLPFLPAHVAADLSIASLIIASFAALWYSLYYLARTPAALPLPHALGGQPKTTDYARAVADGGVLILLSTLGFAQRSHEISPRFVLFVLLCCLTLCLCLVLRKPKQGFIALWFCVLFLGLNRGFYALIPACAWVAVLCLHPMWKVSRLRIALCVFSAAAGSIALLWLMPLLQIQNPTVQSADAVFSAEFHAQFWAANLNLIDIRQGGLDFAKNLFFASNLLLFAWPALPFAILALWRWRFHVWSSHIWFCASYIAVMLVWLLLANDASEGAMLIVLPGAVLLAAFMLPTISRDVMNAVDWFGMYLFSAANMVFWLAWLCLMFGWPDAIATKFLSIAPSFTAQFFLPTFAMGLLSTVFWIYVIRWRIMGNPEVIWRAAVIWSAGLLSAWVLLTTLWMPLLNHTKTYKDVAVALRTQLPAAGHACLSSDRLGLAQRAVFAYFGEIKFESTQITTPRCDWLLVHDSLRELSALERLPVLPDGVWALRWQGRRFSDTDERFRLYERAKP